MLPKIIPLLSDDVTVFVDSGLRRGSDVFKGLAFGAKTVMIGLPMLHALAAFEAGGVEALIETITEELLIIMTS